MVLRCGKEAVASPWASLQPPILGVGRYGESVPLLLSPPGGAPTPSPLLPHQPERNRDSARSDPHQFQRTRSERGPLLDQPTDPRLITGRISRRSLR